MVSCNKHIQQLIGIISLGRQDCAVINPYDDTPPSLPASLCLLITAAYDKAVNMMFQSPEVLDVLYPVIAPHLRNPPALAWALISNADNAANLDGLAFQKLPTSKYKQVCKGRGQ